ncbi:MFS transporter [Nonomuraea roseoviolacea]|uniref:MFS family permease n=1 Tax=Nonomuraea roseoviolacea subsp. carminata TaxID=160689 RepID=A0ABT1KFX9_9ACTN|nr:MFS transporter [Nonomuraea roseoviolacea]MCP2352904.1 MFS family permease [Nonomuraea roseoviolacea subsp. carminata]
MRFPGRGRRLPRNVWLLVVARAVNRLGAFSISFLTVLITSEFGASAATAGLVSSAFGLATIPSRLLGGLLADRLGRRRTIVLGLCCCAVVQLAVAGAGSVAAVAVLAVLLGLAFELYEPPSQAMIADSAGPDDRTRAFSLFNAALAAGGMGAGLIAAAVGRWDLRWLFVVDALTCLACAAVVRLALPGDPPGDRRAEAGGSGGTTPWRDPALVAMFVCGTLFATVYMGIMVALPLALPLRGLEAADAGLLFTVSAVTTVAGQPLLRLRPVAGLPPPVALAVGSVLIAAGLAGYAVARGLPAFVAATVLWSLGDLFMVGRAYAVVAGLAAPDARGRYLAVYGTSWGVAAVAAPLAGTQLLERVGAGGMWAAAAGVCLVLAAAQLGVGPLLARRPPARPPAAEPGELEELEELEETEGSESSGPEGPGGSVSGGSSAGRGGRRRGARPGRRARWPRAGVAGRE